MLTDQPYHIILALVTEGQGAGRRVTYALADVIRRSDPGNDPLADWQRSNPGRQAIWLLWSPVAGAAAVGETSGAADLVRAGRRSDAAQGTFLTETLRGIEIALRIEQGYYGEGESHVNFALKGVPGE